MSLTIVYRAESIKKANPSECFFKQMRSFEFSGPRNFETSVALFPASIDNYCFVLSLISITFFLITYSQLINLLMIDMQIVLLASWMHIAKDWMENRWHGQ